MTINIMKHKTDKYYIYMEAGFTERGTYYEVAVCPMLEDHMCGYPIRNMIYTSSEEKQAKATFRRYVKKYGEE